HYRAGLRSHLMEVLDPGDVAKEKNGVIVDGLRMFPRAVPLKMLRIFRRRFKGLSEASEEIKRVKIIEAYLARDHIARSSEFLVHYMGCGKRDILLAGLQEYIPGEVLEPWGDLGKGHLSSLLDRMGAQDERDPNGLRDRWIEEVQRRAGVFVASIRKLIMETRLMPDLAGVGNLILTRSGDIKLVDINNISEIPIDDPVIPLDDRGYPVCDKSMAALIHLERKLICGSPRRDDPVYGPFLNPKRIEKVKAAEKKFHLGVT
ncbi:MAG: hypothetical protein JRL30_24220, partial [Deltaproteobacteria bacterium]|nr:hypothetical protein [Deltaproteobacteria bacterium]